MKKLFSPVKRGLSISMGIGVMPAPAVTAEIKKYLFKRMMEINIKEFVFVIVRNLKKLGFIQ